MKRCQLKCRQCIVIKKVGRIKAEAKLQLQTINFLETSSNVLPEKNLSTIQHGKISEFSEKFKFGKILGEGAQAVVKQAFTEKGEIVAIKICRSGDPEVIKTFINSYRVSRLLNHPNILKSFELYVDEQIEQLGLVMEYCEFPSLEQYIRMNRQISGVSYFNERTVMNIMENLIKAVQHMHQRGVVHRDLKPDNILISPKNNGATLKIIDFGVSSQFLLYTLQQAQLLSVHKDMWTRTGNYLYCAPEIFSSIGYNEQIDLWACGVIMYQLLFGRLPFFEQTSYDTIEAIIENEIYIPYIPVSQLGLDMLKRLLQKNPIHRLTARGRIIFIIENKLLEAVLHPWFYVNSKQYQKLSNTTCSSRNLDQDDYLDRLVFQNHTRSNSISYRKQTSTNNQLSQEDKQDQKLDKTTQVPLTLIANIQLNCDLQSPLRETFQESPVIKISKLNLQIGKEIHIKKKKLHYFGQEFLNSRLVQQMIINQVDEESINDTQ